MTITSVVQVWSGQTWSDEETGAREYEELYRVYYDDPSESPVSIRFASGLPLPYAPYPGDPAAIAKSRNGSRLSETRLVSEVTIRYEFSPEDDDEPQENPLLRPAKIRWSSSEVMRPFIKDRDGNAVVNSAGDYFDPPPEFPVGVWQVNIQKNVSTIPAAILGWANATNSAAYSVDGVSVEARKSRLSAIEIGEWQTENDISFRVLTMGIVFSDIDLDEVPLLDQGYRIKDGEELKDILIEDEDGKKQRPSAPVLLDGSGSKLTDPTPETAVFIDFKAPTPEINFSALPLA